MHKLIDYVCDKLEEIERKVDKGAELSMTEVQYADTLAHLKKNLLKAEEMSDGEYSNGYYDDRGRSYGDHSYARGRRGNVRRDAMGRYSSRGYSMGTDDMVSELHELMKDAPDEQTKREFKKFIDKIEMM